MMLLGPQPGGCLPQAVAMAQVRLIRASPRTTSRRRFGPAARWCIIVDGEVVHGEPARHRGWQRLRFDHCLVPGLGEFFAGIAGAVGGIGQHHGGFGFTGQQTGADLGVAGVLTVGLGQFAVGDDPGVGFDREVRLEPVLPTVHRLVGVPASGSVTEMTRSGATRCAIRHRPSVPSLPSTGSTCCPALNTNNATASAALAPISCSGRCPSRRCASPHQGIHELVPGGFAVPGDRRLPGSS